MDNKPCRHGEGLLGVALRKRLRRELPGRLPAPVSTAAAGQA